MHRKVWAGVTLVLAAGGLAGCGRPEPPAETSARADPVAEQVEMWAREGSRLEAEFEAALAVEDYQRAFRLLQPVREAMPAELRGRHRFAERQVIRQAEEQAARIAAERAAEAQRLEAARALQKAREDRIGRAPVMSAWDGGYYEVQRYLEERLHDPDSLKFDGCTQPVPREEGWGVICTYRARNGFGALRKDVGTFVIREGEVIAKLD